MSDFTLNTTLTTHEFYVLLALTKTTLHGYGIRDQVIQDSQGSIIMATGTTYALLQRMSKKRLIDRIDATATAKVTYRYRLTPFGRQSLQHEIARLEYVVTHAHLKLGRKLGQPAPQI